MDEVVLVINSGTTNIKFSFFTCQEILLYHGLIENIATSPCVTIFNHDNLQIEKQILLTPGYKAGMQSLFNWLELIFPNLKLKAAGHRIVHSGTHFNGPILINNEVLKILMALTPLAPLHQRKSLRTVEFINEYYPHLPQVACFDTSFHQTQKKIATLFPIPMTLSNLGIIRYGFHGLSYEYISSIVTKQIGELGDKKIIATHLGNGASACAIEDHKSIATSMGFSTLDGLMMGTRCGHLDPGVILYLMQEKNYSIQQIEHLLYKESGLLGVSDISYDMRTLINSENPKAQQAIELFCYRAACEISSLLVALTGINALIFTGGIGENSPIIRKKICEYLSWIGIKINDKYNNHNEVIISDKDSTIIVSVIPSHEEYTIARHTLANI